MVCNNRATVHQFWYNLDGSIRLPPLCELSRVSFMRNSPCTPVVFWAYQPFTDSHGRRVPTRDAREVLPLARFHALLANNHIAHVCDYLRYLILRRLGGWWADMDCICLRPLPRVHRAFQTQHCRLAGAFKLKQPFKNPKLGKMNNAVLFVPPNDPLIARMITWMEEQLPRGIPRWTTVLFKQAEEVVVLKYEKYVAEPVVFGPLTKCAVPAEDDVVKFGFPSPGLKSMRRRTVVMDCWGKITGNILKILTLLDTPGSRALMADAKRLLQS